MLLKDQHKISYSTKWKRKMMSNLSVNHSSKFNLLLATTIMILPAKILKITQLMDLSSPKNSRPLNNQRLPLLRLRKLLKFSNQNQLSAISKSKRFNFPKLKSRRILKIALFKQPSPELAETRMTQSTNLLLPTQ